MKQPKDYDEALEQLIDAEADLERETKRADAYKEAARLLFNAHGKFASEDEKEAARMSYFKVNNANNG